MRALAIHTKDEWVQRIVAAVLVVVAASLVGAAFVLYV